MTPANPQFFIVCQIARCQGQSIMFVCLLAGFSQLTTEFYLN